MTETTDDSPEDKTPSALIMLDFGATGVVKHFDSWAGVISWATEEEKYWDWLDPARRNQGMQGHWASLHNLKAAAQSALQVWKGKSSTDEEKSNAENRVLESAQQSGSLKRVILRGSPIGSFVEQVKVDEGDPQATTLACAYLDPHSLLSAPLKNPGFEERRSDQIREALSRSWQVNSLQFQHSNPEAFAESIKAHLLEWNEAHRQLKGEGESSLTALKADHEAMRQRIADLANDAAEQRAEHQRQMDVIEQDYREKMALREPVEYWSIKREEHAKTAKYWAWAAVALFIGGVAALFYFASSNSSKEVLQQVMAIEGVKPENVGTLSSYLWLANSIRLAVLSLLLVWPLRIFIRNYISQNHLATDAAERVVTIKTYLAMLNDPALREDQELRKNALPLALERVFQKANDGIVQDDGAPVDSILAAMKRK